MLVLMRERDERVMLRHGDCEIMVTVNRVGNGKVWLGFEAPDEFRISRVPSQTWLDIDQAKHGGFDP